MPDEGFRFLWPDDFGQFAVSAEGIGQLHLPRRSAIRLEQCRCADQNADRTCS